MRPITPIASPSTKKRVLKKCWSQGGLKNREQIAEPFIAKTIGRLSDKHACSVDDVKIYACTFDAKAKDVFLFGYIKNEKIGQIPFDWLFS